MSHAAAAAEIMARWRKGLRFAPALDRPDGSASWPPGWRPAAWQPAYRIAPAQAAILAKARAAVQPLLDQPQALSRRNKFYAE